MLFTGVSTIFFNINPLIKIDGYYALSSVLEIPDLREESFRYIGTWFQRHVLRLPSKSRPFPAENAGSTGSSARSLWLWVAVDHAVHRRGLLQPLQPLLPELGRRAAAITLYRLFRQRVRLVTRTAHLFYLDKKELLMSLASARRCWPAPSSCSACPCAMEPAYVACPRRPRPMAAARLEAPEDAVVTRALVEEGDRVEAGQPSFSLVSAAATEETAGVRLRASGWLGEASRERRPVSRTRFRVRDPRHGGKRRAQKWPRPGRAPAHEEPVAGRILTPYLRDLRVVPSPPERCWPRSARTDRWRRSSRSRNGSSRTSYPMRRFRRSSAVIPAPCAAPSSRGPGGHGVAQDRRRVRPGRAAGTPRTVRRPRRFRKHRRELDRPE